MFARTSINGVIKPDSTRMNKCMRRETNGVVKYTKHNKIVTFDECLRLFLVENMKKEMICTTLER